jgi:epi-isozizaene synthase
MSEILELCRLPAIDIPFPRHRHVQQETARQLTRSWAAGKRVLAPELVTACLDDLRYTELIGGYYVGAPLPALVAINDFSLWFFAWDDRHDRDIFHRRHDAWARLCAGLRSALDAPHCHLDDPDPLISSFSDCVIRLSEPFSRRWMARFVTHFHSTIDAYDQEYRNRTTGTVPSVCDYLELRRHTFGMWVWIDCLELAAECELPPQIYLDDAYQRVGLASQEFSAWCNDLYSMPKEMAAGDFHNLGIVLARERNLTGFAAAEEVAAMVRRRIADYQAEESRVRALLDNVAAEAGFREGVERCLFNMRNWISSVYWFHHESGRYRVNSWDDPAKPPYILDPDEQ